MLASSMMTLASSLHSSEASSPGRQKKQPKEPKHQSRGVAHLEELVGRVRQAAALGPNLAQVYYLVSLLPMLQTAGCLVAVLLLGESASLQYSSIH